MTRWEVCVLGVSVGGGGGGYLSGVCVCGGGGGGGFCPATNLVPSKMYL